VNPSVWFYAYGNQPRGPVDTASIRELVRANVITANTLVWRKPDPNWQPAGSFPELIPIQQFATPRSEGEFGKQVEEKIADVIKDLVDDALHSNDPVPACYASDLRQAEFHRNCLQAAGIAAVTVHTGDPNVPFAVMVAPGDQLRAIGIVEANNLMLLGGDIALAAAFADPAGDAPTYEAPQSEPAPTEWSAPEPSQDWSEFDS